MLYSRCTSLRARIFKRSLRSDNPFHAIRKAPAKLKDFSLDTIFLDRVRFGGTLADSSRATLTTIAAMDCYDQTIFFENATMVSQTCFVDVLISGDNLS